MAHKTTKNKFGETVTVSDDLGRITENVPAPTPQPNPLVGAEIRTGFYGPGGSYPGVEFGFEFGSPEQKAVEAQRRAGLGGGKGPIPGDNPPSVPFQPEDASVSRQLNQILSADSPLLTRARTRGAQVANRRGLLNSSLGVQAGEAAAIDVALPIASQQAGQIHQTNLQGGQIASAEKLGFANIASFNRQQATMALAKFDTSYQEAFRTISSNENIPAATREKYLTHLAAIRDTNFNLVEQIYDISLVWESPVVRGG